MVRRAGAARVAVGVLLGTVLLAGCDTRFGSQQGSTDQGERVLELWQLMVVIALVILALVLGLVVWCVVRYRRRTGEIPSQRQYVIPVEVVYTVVPILIVAVVFGVSWSVQNDVDALAREPDVVVEATGFQWQWQFVYEDRGVTVTGLPGELPVMVMPVGETVRIELTSRDVIHSMYVPEFLFKRDAIPGIVNRFDFTPRKTGRFLSRCAEFCGLDHSRMLFYVEVMTQDDFDRWVEEQARVDA